MPRFPSDIDRIIPPDDNYDHDLDDPEFYHYDEETDFEDYEDEEEALDDFDDSSLPD